ncbi:manganese efflux pump MntP family protein [Rummeliibacillus sp. NPDC094406]|uniref:manganese efflux pump MntP n=1 Tax=Rummeliibacillus sp. NPDC094406 TaxID=3364511 RepID=UPI00381FE97A
MHWITIILIGIAANLDNLGIGLAYGVKKTKVPLSSNFTIAVISMIVTYLSVMIGSALIDYITPHKANFVGNLMLCAIGLYTIISYKISCTTSAENLEGIDKDRNNIITFREALVLGLILSINCLGSGIAIGANGISAIWTVISIGFFSILTFAIGDHFGLLLSKTFIGKYSTVISGLILIFIGVFEIFI